MTELDLTGVICPLNWVKAKLALDELASGDRLELRLDPGESVLRVSQSAREAGHLVEVADTGVSIIKR